MSSFKSCIAVVGYPGRPNIRQKLEVGDAVLCETTDDGILEVRATALHHNSAEFLVSQVSPRIGLGAAIFTGDPENLPFTEAERERITQSIAAVKAELAASGRHTAEQLSLINRKLDEIAAASGRLGRKDFLNWVAATLTGLCISADFAPEVAKDFIQTVSSAFSWLFTNAQPLLQWSGGA